MKNALEAHFGLPEGFLPLTARTPLSQSRTWFRVGASVSCFGTQWVPGLEECAGGPADISSHIAGSGRSLQLPFDLDEVVRTLRLEHYPLPQASSLGLARSLYYFLRPALPVGVRKYAQQRALRGWDRRSFPAWPVDRTVERLFEFLLAIALRSGGTIPFIWFWPQGKRGCILMTHDVESQAGLLACTRLMALDERHGVPASFQLIPGARYAVADSVLKEIRARGFEANLHDWKHDGLLFSSRKLFLKRLDKINAAAARWHVEGFRSGALYRNAEWLQMLNVAYDMSIPSVAHLDPQPGGCCTAFPWFLGRLLEIPVTMTQDYSLFHILNRYSIQLWQRQLDLILEGNGMASFIVHPDYIQERRALSVYTDLLQHLQHLNSEKNLWLTLPGQVNRWWRNRSQMQLVQRDGMWKIEGPQCEDARVAFARCVDGRLLYDIAPPAPSPTAELSTTEAPQTYS